ncbi:MAG: hypothetical protein V2A78_00965 [bacterium]
MKKLIGVILMIISLGCIIATVVEVATGKAGLWSESAIGAYVFHPLTMVAALWLLAGKKPEAPREPAKEGGA